MLEAQTQQLDQMHREDVISRNSLNFQQQLEQLEDNLNDRRDSRHIDQNNDRFDESGRLNNSRNLSSSVSVFAEEKKETHDSSQIIQDPDNTSQDKRYTCLVANDELVQLLMVEAILEKQGFKVVTTNNGQEAYEVFMENFY